MKDPIRFYQLHSELFNFKLSNIKLSGFSMFPTTLFKLEIPTTLFNPEHVNTYFSFDIFVSLVSLTYCLT